MRNAKAVILIALTLTVAAHAQNPSPPPTVSPPDSNIEPANTAVIPARVEGVATVGDLARLQSQALMAEATQRLMEAKRSIGHDGASTNIPGDPATPGTLSSTAALYEAPVVIGIHGTAAHPYALLRVSDAAVISVRAGDALPGGWTVQRVAPQGVTVRSESGTRTLGFLAAMKQPSSSE